MIYLHKEQWAQTKEMTPTESYKKTPDSASKMKETNLKTVC